MPLKKAFDAELARQVWQRRNKNNISLSVCDEHKPHFPPFSLEHVEIDLPGAPFVNYSDFNPQQTNIKRPLLLVFE